jgi:hypothetical protein
MSMDRWQRKIDDPLQKIAEESASLPGAGKPLNLHRDPYTPDEMQMANKLLKDNDLAPAWITEGRELDTLREKVVAKIHKAVHNGGMTDRLRDEVTGFNKRVLTYNLKAPAGITHKMPIHLERELQRAQST